MILTKFSSGSGGNAPKLTINGSTSNYSSSADTFVSDAHPTYNYGGSTLLEAQSCGWGPTDGDNKWIYLQYTINSMPLITGATLDLYAESNGDGGAKPYLVAVYAGNNNWTQGTSNGSAGSGLTWNLRPNFNNGTTTGPTDFPFVSGPPAGYVYGSSSDTYQLNGGRVAISQINKNDLVWVAEDYDTTAGTEATSDYVYYSLDRGTTWNLAMNGSNPMTVGATSQFTENLLPLTADALGNFYVYSSTNTTVYKSTDGGKTWSSSGLTSGFTATGTTYNLQAEPDSTGNVWFMDQTSNAGKQFEYWNNSTLSWGSISGPIDGTAKVVDFTFGAAGGGYTNPTAIVQMSDGSFWFSNNATGTTTSPGSATWTPVNDPIVPDGPNLMQGDMQTYGLFYVGTLGRGTFYTDFNTNGTGNPDVMMGPMAGAAAAANAPAATSSLASTAPADATTSLAVPTSSAPVADSPAASQLPGAAVDSVMGTPDYLLQSDATTADLLPSDAVDSVLDATDRTTLSDNSLDGDGDLVIHQLASAGRQRWGLPVHALKAFK